ncbi:protocadherin Fat 4-like [Saccoglossus kowalevskii]|uniref:Protocadherin Fat 4-like n=1 Tax=Saccoglossus kowalevskii TaxID=10224 RepID=A0ABM0GRL6_SACKO|nr:PREDICTED: protocadherin Fat 4-like [Saccoglossus kowalevskii]
MAFTVPENSYTGSAIISAADITATHFPEGEGNPPYSIIVSAPGPTTLFDIDETGVLSVGSTVPNFETHGGTYTVDIICHQISGNDSIVQVTVTVLDVVERCTLSWPDGPYTVAENTATGSEIIAPSELLSSFPEDAATTAYTISSVSPGAMNMFSIDSATGAILIGTSPPDRELDDPIQTINVTCHQLSANDNTNTVTVIIINVLEGCSLQWSNASYIVDENSNSGYSVIAATDITDEVFPEGAGSPKYRINRVVPGPDELFSIDASTGAIVIGSLTPNFEVHGLIVQTIFVDCLQQSGPNNTLAVNVNIRNIDETPTFVNLPTTIKISESIGASQSVFKVFYNDPEGVAVTVDVSTQTPVTPTFTVVNGNEIHSPAGLDYDFSDQTYTFTIRVDDGTNTDTSTLTINLYNEIDEPPTFPASDYTGTIEEEQSYGTVVTWTTNPVADMIASYNEVGDSKLYYEISGPYSDDFNCDRLTGVITTSRTLDADDVSSTASYSLTLTVGDSAGHTDTTTLSITLTDINDNKPIFSPSLYYKAIDENSGSGVIAATMTVSDEDAGVFGTVTLTITSGVTAKFTLSGNEILTTADPLDYETTTSYTMTVTATDGGGEISTATVIVDVVPVNEFMPTFVTFPTSSITVPENSAVRYEILAATDVTVRDSDHGDDGEISFYISSVTNGGINKFSMDSSTGRILTTSTFDYESGTISYTITCVAADQGSPGPSSTTRSLTVHISDENDNAPYFDQNYYSLTITEGDVIGTVITTFNVNDDDSAAITTISYQFYSGNELDKFEMDDTTNKLKVKSVINLDDGDPEEFSLLLHILDGGTPELTGTAMICISLTSSNDYDPVFSSTNPSTISISENAYIGTTVAEISVSDNDYGSDGDLTLVILSGDKENNFHLDSFRRILQTKKLIEYEDTGSPIVLTIQATDGGATPRTATSDISIIVTKENNYKPTCTPTNYVRSILESAAASDQVTQINCQDMDLDTLSYTIIAGNGDENFQVDGDGLVSIVSSGDTIDYESGVDKYSLTIEVSDGAHMINVYVTVNIEAVNEDAPAFDVAGWTVDLYENTPLGDVIVLLASSVTDTDTGGHGISLYIITSVDPPSGKDAFQIDGRSGKIYLAKLLDYEDESSYDIAVEVEDGGGLTDTAVVAIRVLDVNDNSPSCLKSSFLINVDEHTYPYTAVSMADLGCTDADSGMFGTAGLVYTLGSQIPCCDFDVDSSGIFLRVDNLDYEGNNMHFTITLNVADGGLPPRTMDVLISISVNPVDDGPPVCAGPYVSSVPEDALIGTTIETFRAIDPDSDETSDGQVRYTITGGNNAGHFAIDSSIGIVQTIALLDGKKIHIYTLEITATDGNGGTCVDTLDITVTSVNGVKPSCTQYSYGLDLDEDTPVGTLFSLVCTDDDPVDSTLTYTLTSGDASMFGVNTNGEVFLQSKLDYDVVGAVRHYDIEVTVSDAAAHEVTVSGSINVQPVNEGSPTFTTRFYTLDVNEDIAIGTTIITVSAKDTDSPVTTDGTLIYTFSPECKCPEFQMNRYTGEITLLLPLDYEISTSYLLPIKASDGDKTDTASVVINVVDVNDNSPVFLPVSYSGTVQEELPAGQVITKITVTDNDSAKNDNNAILLTIKRGNIGASFSVDSTTGELKTTGPIDYESSQLFTLEVVAADRNGAPGANTATTLVIVHIDPVNEYFPVFQSISYSTSTSEYTATGVTLLTISATGEDLASHPHGQVKYTIASGNDDDHFSLDDSTGDLVVIKRFDFETISSHTLVVTATDSTAALGDQLSTDVDVEIIIEDENDNTPTCDSQPYVVSISENESIGQTVMSLVIQDSDSGTNGEVDITKTSGDVNNDFVLTNKELVLDQLLVYHITPVYNIVFTVTDRGSPPLSTNCVVTVNVLPENNYAPVFSTNTENINILESLEIGNIVYTAFASDDDGIGSDGNITYKIVAGNADGKFAVDRYSGDILIQSQLDHEITDQYILEITAIDGGSTSLTGTMTLTVKIEDVNDNTPIFTHDIYTTTILEHMGIGTSVLTVKATDIDSGANAIIEYSITKGMSHEHFSIDRVTGEIMTTADLDFETRSIYSFKVKASDGGIPMRSSDAFVRIIIDDVNDNHPVIFPHFKTVAISEHSASNTLVIPQWTLDDDSGKNGNISFSLVSGDPLGQFYIDTWGGTIFTSGAGQVLDREVQDIYQLMIEASDTGTPAHSTTNIITVVIEDENDNPPVVNPATYDITVSEDVAVGSSILTILATDVDANENGRLTYKFTSGNNGTFAIVPTSGVLTVALPLDRETTASHSLHVTVSDNGNVQLFAEASVTLTISDANDNVPQFSQNIYTFYVLENSPFLSLVGNVLATDRDVGSNSRINYTIASGPHDHFILDIVTGSISTSADIDRENIESYSYNVKATDNGTPSRYNFTSVVIVVEDENDNYPVFNEDEYSVTIAEDHDVNAYVLTVDATDADNGTNAELTYSFHSSFPVGDEYFSIDGSTGEITLKQAVDYEAVHTLEFVVICSDNGSPVLTTTTTVYVNLTDVNDNAPEFNPAFYSAEITTECNNGEPIVTVSATDAEDGETMKYILTDASEKFKIDINTGDITLIADYTYALQTGQKYELRVEAEDYGTPTSSDEAIVRIDIFDASLYLVEFYMTLSKSLLDFKLTKSDFLQAITDILHVNFPTGRCGISHITIQDARDSQNTRKLLTDGNEIIVHVYAIADDTTDVIEGLNLTKKFVLASHLFDTFTVDSTGAPTDDLKGGVFEQWNIEKVIYDNNDLSTTDWYQLWWGILVIGCASIVFLLLLAAFIRRMYPFCCSKQKEKKLDEKDKAKANIDVSKSRGAWTPGSDKRRPIDPTLNAVALGKSSTATATLTKNDNLSVSRMSPVSQPRVTLIETEDEIRESLKRY